MKKKKYLGGVLLIWISAIVGIFLLIQLILKFVQPPPPRHIVIASGSPDGAYYAIAKEYETLLKKEGITCQILNTKGSVENLQLLNSGKVDLAFLQSGISSADNNQNISLRSIASIYYEPLWVFYRGIEELDLINQLTGKRIGVGEDNSGTKAVTIRLLELNGITPHNSEFKSLSSQQMSDQLISGELDAAFLVTSPNAKSFKKLLANDNIQLMNFRRYQAYARNFLFVKDLTIPEGMLDIQRNIPKQNITLLSTLATLVATDKMHPQLVEVMLNCAQRIHKKQGLLEKEDEFPAKKYLEFPVHDAAANYFYSGPSFLAKYLPFWLVTLIRRLAIIIIPLLTLLFPLFKITPLAIRWPIKRKLNLWYSELEEIESLVNGDSDKISFINSQKRLNELEEEVVNDPLPPAYKNESFQLRFHIRHVQNQISEALGKSEK